MYVHIYIYIYVNTYTYYILQIVFVLLQNLVCLACIFVIISVATAATTARPQVTDDALDNALNDKRYLQRQLKCALGEGACDPVGRRLKSKQILLNRI